ncbi:V-type immunoglobulin domain-containing suppressor of T-cell activation [Erpetoichthys calabaricus]|uniref:V-set immunoregulatory receptor n=1 Tax=Erpetoichthys calabaricus TaxID=27687 RepID=A0A8C4S7C9_ERPCA|nr:V-type immunoglobulin domain-containing suppressor of T-cell activation [Erpetoichthys calabaricus]
MDLHGKKGTAVLLCVLSYLAAWRGVAWTMKVIAPHVSFSCPEGTNVTLPCIIVGPLSGPHDKVGRNFHFSVNKDPKCPEKVHPRHANEIIHKPQHGVYFGINHKGKFWITLTNLTLMDQGTYCCIVYDVAQKSNSTQLQQIKHAYIDLNVTKWNGTGNENCIIHDASHIEMDPKEASIAAGLATAGCIMGVLSLPLILLLVYKQRQSVVSTRRAHELVRMDSEAQGHENPVFEEVMGEAKTRTVAQIMRQQSESGRHLLSEPNTPLSPPVHGDCFFPSQEPIPESPDLVKI